MSKRCKTCGEEIEDGMNFCPNCGQPCDDQEDRQAIRRAMQDLNAARPQREMKQKEIKPEREIRQEIDDEPNHGRGPLIVLGLLAIAVVAVVGALIVGMLRNEGVEQPAPENPTAEVPETPTENPDTDPETPTETPTQPQDPEEENPQDNEENTGDGEGLAFTDQLESFGDTLHVDRIEATTEEDTLRFTIYYETTVPLSVSLVDDTGTMQIGPIDLGENGGYAYFEINRNYVASNQLMFLFNQSNEPTVAGEIIIEKEAFESYLN